MPESMSIERRRLMAAYGANLELTPREKGMKGAIEKAHELVRDNPNAWMPMQFDNPANIKSHVEHTAQEILADAPEGFDYYITGVGTGGHLTGVAEVLKPKFPNLQVFAVEPELSPVISGGAPGPHPIQGIGAGFIPDNLHTDRARRYHPGQPAGSLRHGPPRRPRRRHLHGHLLRRFAGRRGQKAATKCPRAAACSLSATIPASGTCR